MLTDHDDQSIIELIGDKYKIEQTQGHTLTDNTQVESITMMVPETQNTTHITSFTILYFQRLKKTRDLSLEVTHTPKKPLKHTEEDTTIILILSRTFSLEFKEFAKSVERKFEELEKAIIGLSEQIGTHRNIGLSEQKASNESS